MTFPPLPICLRLGQTLGLATGLAAVLLLGCSLLRPGQSADGRATVLSIGDGDTIRVLQGQQRITVRLACIDAPEMAQAPYGAQSRAYLQTRLRIGSPVTLLPQTVDRYGRTVAEVIGEVNLNLAMVEDGQVHPLRGPAAMPTASTWASATPGSMWRPSSGRPAAATGCGGCRVGSPAPGTFTVAEQRGDQPAAPGGFLVAGWFAAVRSAPLPAPRSCCAKDTPIWMGMVMVWPAKASAEGSGNRTLLLWPTSAGSLWSS